MSASYTVKIAAMAIAAGLLDHNPRRARVTLTLQPSAGDGNVDLRQWPTRIRMLKNFRIRLAQPTSRGTAPTGPLLEPISLEPTVKALGRSDDAETASRVQALWERVMAPGPGMEAKQREWDALKRILDDMIKPSSNDGAGRIVVPPTHLAALAYPFERGRLALDVLAGTDGPLATRQPVRATRHAAANRVRLAHLDQLGVASDAPFIGSPTYQGSFSAAPSKMPAAEIARIAMGHHDGLGPAIGEIRRVHRAATPDRCRSPISSNLLEDGALADAARRRLGGLLGAPVLQRLFGLALDFEFDLDAWKAHVPADGMFVLIAATFEDEGDRSATVTPVWTLSKLRLGSSETPGYFGPATWAEHEWVADGSKRDSRPGVIEGMEVLDRDASPGHPKFAMATVDPELAIEGDLANPSPDKSARGTLRSGGLRLLDTQAEASTRVEDARRKASGQRAIQASGSSADVVQDADDLHPLKRLDLGIDTDKQPAWRCAGHRIVRYHDPSPGAPRDWVEKELTRLLGPPNGRRRIELDAATVSRSSMKVHADAHDDMPHLPDPTKYPDLYQAQKGKADADRAASDATYANTVTIASATVAAWGGEPMGSPTVHSDCPAMDELGISRTVSLPSSRTGEDATLLAMPMRFGWPYRVGIRQVFPAGVCLPLSSAAARYARQDGHECLPSIQRGDRPQSGRRVLRHERVEAPLLALLAGEAAGHEKMPKQGAAQAIVRTAASPDLATPRVARRILAAPNVPLHFATLHDAFRGWRPRPGSDLASPPGGPLDGHLRGGNGQPLEVDVEHRTSPRPASTGAASCADPSSAVVRSATREPVYPDPAASIMVMRLRSPVGSDAWVGEPLVIPIQRQWPEVLPVLVELQAHDALKGPRAKYVGIAPLGRRGRWGLRTGLEAHKVEVSLQPAEDLYLDVWCVPTIEQLVAWFDVVETAAVLAAHDDGSPDDPDRTCSEALARLVGKPIGDSAPLPGACVAGGGLAAPSRATLRALAGMLYQTLLQRPITSLAGVQSLRLVHAVALPQAKPRLDAAGPSRLALVRRLFAAGDVSADSASGTAESRLDFIAKVPIGRWTETANEEGAIATLFGGGLDVDLASTVSIELQVECADPGTDKLDNPDQWRRTPSARAEGDWSALKGHESLSKHFGFDVRRDRRVALPRQTVVPLRIDGLPVPADGAAGRHHLTLEALQAASWSSNPGKAHIAATATPALRTILDPVFATTGARLLTITPVAIGRHANLMHPAGAHHVERHALNAAVVRGESVQVWLPATQRPAPPVIHDIEVRLDRASYGSEANGSHTVGVRQTTLLRIRLARPWYSSGEGEKLGLVLWPPSIFFRDPPYLDVGGQPLPATMSDLDLGPVGPFVTRWASDASEVAATSLEQLVPATAFSFGERDPASRITTAFMPLPSKAPAYAAVTQACPSDGTQCVDKVEGKNKDQNGPGTKARPYEPPPDFSAVALLTAEPRFDIERENWFVDLELLAENIFDPYIRLGLVRYQPNAREDVVPPEGEEPTRLRVSTPVSVSARVFPTRSAEVTWRKAIGGGTDVYVTVRVSRPVEGNGGGPGAAVRVILSARRKEGSSRSGQHVTAVGSDGQLCVWESWATSEGGNIARTLGATAFTCLFKLPYDAENDQWSHIATVESFSRRPPANYKNEPIPEAGDPTLNESGPDFLAILEMSTSNSVRSPGNRPFTGTSWEHRDRTSEAVP